MSEHDELRAILAILIKKCFPDHFENCMNALNEMSSKVKEICEDKNLLADDKETMMRTITDSLAYAALNFKLKAEPNHDIKSVNAS
jgi:hypothetical protein